MTTAGSAALWALADHFGVIPSPPNLTVTALLRDWWRRPRTFGCSHARSVGASWVVVAPDVSVYCPDCASPRSARIKVCAFCRESVDESDCILIWQEMRATVTVVGRAHVGCAEPDETSDEKAGR